MTASPARGTALGSCAGPLRAGYDALLLDLDGVLYLGPEPVPHAAEGVAAARHGGLAVAFVTNNASRSVEEVAAALRRVGVDAAADDVVTSGQAAARLVADRVPAGSAVLVTGSAALAEQVAAAGLRPVRSATEAGGSVAAVVQGLSPATTWADLAEATRAVHAGALWVTGNRDSTLPSPGGPLPGNGTMVAAVAVATGREPLVAGKPEPALHAESVARVGAQRPLVVGDRLDTDVLGAVRAGADSLLVLTGVVDVPALLAARPGERPTFVARDLRGLGLPHPPVVVSDDGAVCGGWRAAVEDAVVRLHRLSGPDAGPEAHVQALRAACAAAWAHGAGPVVDGLPDAG